jgi:hypothetical protein
MSSVDAFQDCLAAEHAAVWGYGVIGGVLAGIADMSRQRGYAEAAYLEHRRRRDLITAIITDRGASAVAAEPAYELPFHVADAAACERLARGLETDAAAVYADALADLDRSERALAVDALADCAVRAHLWGAKLVALPGL